MSNPLGGPQTQDAMRTVSPLLRFPTGVLESDTPSPVLLEFHQAPVSVYLREHPGVDPAGYRADLALRHQEFMDRLIALGHSVQLSETRLREASPQGTTDVAMTHDFTEVFNGIGVIMPGKSVMEVAHMAEVRAITYNRERAYLHASESISFTGAPKVWERVDSAGRALKGEGVKVAIIDTGVDWTHPAFGGFSSAPNDKVVYAASYTGEFPIDNFGHGTHVAGIVAADNYTGTPRGDSKIVGMAPRAQLMSYKVLTAAGSGSASNIILAMEDAVKRGADVMNLSLGDSMGDPNSPESSAANNAMVGGCIVCIAAGNSGPERSTVGSPGAAHNVLTVGASTDTGVTALIAQLLVAAGAPRDVEMRLMEGSTALPSPALELMYVPCAAGLSASDFPKSVKGKVALVQRGSITFSEKAQNAAQAGAAACVIYNNRDGNFYGTISGGGNVPTIPVVSVSKADGEFMVSLTDKSGVGAVPLRLSPEAVPQPDRLAEFSSRGPNHDGWIKPELTAPGVNIYSSTIIEAPSMGGGMPDPSGYMRASGTSMATPHVAGACALLRQAHPTWSPSQVKAALVNTARLMPGQGTVMDQGNGAMDLLKAIDCRAILVTTESPSAPTHAFGTVVNWGKETVARQALTLHGLTDGTDTSIYTLSVEIAAQPAGLKGELSVSTVDCGKSCVAAFDLILRADGAVLADGAYYGWVVAKSDWGTLRFPFYYEASKQPGAAPPAPSNVEFAAPKMPIRFDGLARM